MIEEEFKEEYIRVQFDVASAILGGKTQAKVLIDPYQGSRQAHRFLHFARSLSSRTRREQFACWTKNY